MTTTHEDDQVPAQAQGGNQDIPLSRVKRDLGPPMDGADGNQGGQGIGPDEEALVEYNAWSLEQHPGAREAFMAMLEAVPEPDDDAAARIVMEIMQAQSIEDLDKPWDVEGMRDYDGTVLQVQSIAKMPSDYKTGLGCYLVCKCTQPGVGEVFTLTTGSVSIVAQLVRAHTLEAFPLEVVPRQSERPTRKGYRPMHLELVRRGRRVRAQVVDQQPDRKARQAEAAGQRRARILDEAREGGRVMAGEEQRS